MFYGRLKSEALKAHAALQADEQSAWGDAWTDTGYVSVLEDGQHLAGC